MRYLTTLGWRLILALMVAIAVAALGGSAASAQEDNTSAPPPLQFPTLPSPEAPLGLGDFGVGVLRGLLEQAGNAELCMILTKEEDPNAVFDPDFTFADCDPAIATMVNNDSGSVRWASGARPTKCGSDCMGRPTNARTFLLDRPNRRFAYVNGRLTFTGTRFGISRDVIFPVEVRFECRVGGGLKVGEVRPSTVVGQPYSDEPGFAESIVNVLLFPFEISRRIDNKIVALGAGGNISGQSLGRCTSIGANRTDPQDPTFDSFVWDIPPQPPPQGGLILPPGSTATIVFDSIVRNQTLEKSPPPAAPLQFLVYINGNVAVIPRVGTITLAPGARHDQKYCRTVNVVDAENLQILFVDNIGGTVWSQFPRQADFGNGPPRRMTTGRQYFEAPTPIQGVELPPGGDKPLSFIAREFEVQYHIVYQPQVAVQPTSTPGGPVAPTPDGGGVIVIGTPPPPPPCIKI